MNRKPVVIGNWKMELSYKGEVELARALKKLQAKIKQAEIDVVVCPSFPSLSSISEQLKGSNIGLGAQGVHEEEKGAWTGSVSVYQIAPFVEWCIVGHSEQRKLTGMTDEQAQRQASLLVRHGVAPVVCVGETAQERDDDRTVEVISTQMETILKQVTRTELVKMVVAYEPIWAISSNNPTQLPDSSDVAGIMLLIRKLTAARCGGEAAERLRIIYGGSVKPDTVGQYIGEPGVDGVLVGSASLQPRWFMDIVKVARAKLV